MKVSHFFRNIDKEKFDGQIFKQARKKSVKLQFVVGPENKIFRNNIVIVVQVKSKVSMKKLLILVCDLIVLLWSESVSHPHVKWGLFESFFPNVVLGLPKSATGYAFFEHSCYIDTILVILFFGNCSVFRKVIRTNEPSTKLSKTLCSNLQSLRRGDPLTCIDFKKDLLVEVKKLGSAAVGKKILAGVQLSCSLFYDLLTDVYPTLKMYPDSQSHSTFPMQDFVYDNVWLNPDKSLPKMIVFENILGRPIKYLNSSNGDTLPKKNIFGKTLKLKNTGPKPGESWYSLFGVVIHEGSDTSESSGGHFVAWFQRENTWYYYDDLYLLGAFTEKKFVPSSVFQSQSFSRPMMYFYELLSFEV